MTIIKRMSSLCLILAFCVCATSCTVVKIDREAESGKGKIISSGEKSVDVASYMEAHWEADILPEIDERKCDMATLLDKVKSGGWDKAGETYGVKKGDIGTKYNFIVQDTAVVKEINTESKAGFMVIALEGQPDALIKIATGPVLKGTAIRDALKCVDFNQFVNQMDYAKLANELNRIGNENVTQNADILALNGKTIEFTGCFTQPDADTEILIMPIFMEVK